MVMNNALVRLVRGAFRRRVLDGADQLNPSAGATCHSLTENEAGMDMPGPWQVRRRDLPEGNQDRNRLVLRYPPADALLVAHRLRAMADAVERLGKRQGVI